MRNERKTKMKKLAALLFVVLFILESFLVFTKANSTTKTTGIICIINFAGDSHRTSGDGIGEFKSLVRSGYVDILIAGDGGAIVIRI